MSKKWTDIENDHRIFTILWVLCLLVMSAAAFGLISWLAVAGINTLLLVACCGALWVLS